MWGLSKEWKTIEKTLFMKTSRVFTLLAINLDQLAFGPRRQVSHTVEY